MRRDDQCGRRAAAGEAGAADVPEREGVVGSARLQMPQDWLSQSFGRATFCRAGFAGRGTASARSTERHTFASALDPRRSLGSRS